jgi:hypothetical protein
VAPPPPEEETGATGGERPGVAVGGAPRPSNPGNVPGRDGTEGSEDEGAMVGGG